MVYYFLSKTKSLLLSNKKSSSPFSADEEDVGPQQTIEHTIFMGKDKFENDHLLKHSHPKNIWFHVDNLSSAHVYLQLTSEELCSNIPNSYPSNLSSFSSFHINETLLNQLAQLTKSNSIKGNKINNVTIIYTPVENLHHDGTMDVGTVSYKNPKLVRRVHVPKKENAILNALKKTQQEVSMDVFIADQESIKKQVKNMEKSGKLKQLDKWAMQEQEQRLEEEEKEEAKGRKKKGGRKLKGDPYADLFTEENVASSRGFDEDDFW